MALLNGYVQATEIMRDIDQYVVPPQLEARPASWAAWCWPSKPILALTASDRTFPVIFPLRFLNLNCGFLYSEGFSNTA